MASPSSSCRVATSLVIDAMSSRTSRSPVFTVSPSFFGSSRSGGLVGGDDEIRDGGGDDVPETETQRRERPRASGLTVTAMVSPATVCSAAPATAGERIGHDAGEHGEAEAMRRHCRLIINAAVE